MCSCSILNSLLKCQILKIDNWKYRTFCKIVTQPIEKVVKKRKKSHAKEIDEYLKSSEHLSKIKDQIPERYMQMNRTYPDDCYLVDHEVAKRIVDNIIPSIKKNNATVVESNPGFGFITHELLKAGIPKIHLYEPTVSFRDHILKLSLQYPEKIKIFNKDFFSLWKLSYQDRYDDGERVVKMLSGITPKDWNEDFVMNIIGVLSTSSFIKHLILSLVFQFSIMTYGRCELYLCMPHTLYLQLTAGPNSGFTTYRSSSVLFQIFCEYEILDKIPRKAFLPWDIIMKGKRNKFYSKSNVDWENLYLTKITFKPLPVPVELLQPLWYFVRHTMVSRKNRIIPLMEKWIPGCGLRLIIPDGTTDPTIYSNVHIYSRVGDLTAAQMLSLFKTFSSWPEYTESPFLASMETGLLKMEHGNYVETFIKKEDHEEHVEDVELEVKENENVEK